MSTNSDDASAPAGTTDPQDPTPSSADAPGTGDAGTDTSAAAGSDTGTDTGEDTGTGSVGTDAGSGSDAGTDAGTGTDDGSGSGSATDAGTDTGTDAGGADAGSGSGTDPGADSGTGSGTDSSAGSGGSDPVTDTGTDSGTVASADTGTGSGTDASADTGTGSGGTDGSTQSSGSAGQGSAGAAQDREPPFLVADLYALDSGHEPPWATLVARPDFVGVIIKAMQVPYSDGGWFGHNWPLLKTVGGDRYGTSWFRGAYLFLDFSRDGAAQADAYLAAVEAAGGWDSGDIIPIVDAELGEKPGGVNYIKTTKGQQVLDVAGAAVDRLKAKTGRRVMLYGRSALAENHIKSTLGCDVAWNPSYTPHPVLEGFEAFAPEDIVLWQYAGDNKGVLAGYPTSIPGFTKLDLSVFIKGAQKPTLDDVRARLL